MTPSTPVSSHSASALSRRGFMVLGGIGMCGACRVRVDNNIRFACVDGPEFDGHKVDFDNMMMRMKAFKEREDHDRHVCRIGLSNGAH